jgi:ParB-like chromosome segregation protein Spo0J
MSNKPKIQIENVAVGDLIPYAGNAKRHDDAQVAAIAASIKEFGFNNPVLIDTDNGIIAGHGRVLAARKLELETVPCIRLKHLTDAQRRAYIIADNRLSEIGGGWDEELLKVELAGLKDEGEIDPALTGFTQADIDRMLTVGRDDEDDAPAEFPEHDETIETEHRCPKCSYEWSGKSK